MKKSIKQILSAALALVLMVSAMAMPTSAAGYTYSSEMMHAATTLTGNSAIKTDGSIWGWGNGYAISHHVATHQDTPVKSSNPHGFVSIGGMSEGEAWGITENGDLWLWNRYDEVFEKQMGDVASFAYYWGKSYELCLAIKTDGTLVGWGWGSEFGDMLPGVAANTDPTITAEDAIVLATDVKQVETGDRFWAMLKKDGTFWTCGYNLRGFLTASPSAGEEIIPLTKVMDNVSAFACGPITANTMLVIKQDGSLWSWELLDATPKRILEDVVFAKTSGSTHFAITKDGTLYGWGDNDYSQAGGGSASSTTPVAVANNAVSVSVNGMSAVMLKSDGTAWSCGLNNYGQCGVPKGGSYLDSNVTEWTKFLDGVALPGTTPTQPTPPATNEIKVLLNGTPVVFDQAPIIEAGRTLVPMRAIFEAMGATVTWEQATQTVTGTKGDIIIKMSIGNPVMTVNGNAITLDVAPKVLNGRTLVPVRAVAESFDADVKWDGTTQTVIITTAGTGDSVGAPIVTPVEPENPATPTVSIDDYRQELFELTNEERAKVGAAALTYNDDLSEIAQARAEALAELGALPSDHNIPGMGDHYASMRVFGFKGATYAGENFATGATPSGAMANWRSSTAGHWQNLLGQLKVGSVACTWTDIGIGCAEGSNGVYYWVQIFVQ